MEFSQGQRLGVVVPLHTWPGMPPVSRSRFQRDRDYRGGTDTDHVPVIPGDDFPPDTCHREDPPLPHPAPDDADMGQAEG